MLQYAPKITQQSITQQSDITQTKVAAIMMDVVMRVIRQSFTPQMFIKWSPCAL